MALKPPPIHALIDGNKLPTGLPCPATTLVKGDAKSLSIAAASILAKVTRDHEMAELDMQYPDYGFAQHKGYPTQFHMEQLKRLGPLPCHRRSFGPVKILVSQADLFGALT
jgi:ribonuclease HII